MLCPAAGVAYALNLKYTANMFVRKRKNASNSVSVQIIEGYRVDGRVRHKIIKHIGTAVDEMQLEKLLALGEQVKSLILRGVTQEEVNSYHQRELSKIIKQGPSILNCNKVKTKITGIHKIYGEVFEEFGLSNTCKWSDKYYNAFKDIIMARIASPSSKRMAVQTLLEDFDIEHSLNTVYRMMDKLNQESIANIQRLISEYTVNLVGGKINVLFYDVTTIYFESFTSDDLKKLGYSKDNKFNQPQIVLTLLVTDKGLPLGYQILPGNTYEGHTLITAIEKWQSTYPDSNFVLVADSGMLNNSNLSILDEKGINYIVCARIKNLPKATKEELLSYKTAKDLNHDFYHTIDFSKRKLILSYKVSRAQKDKSDRDRAVEQLMHKLSKSKNPASLISNYGYKKFIAVKGNSTIMLEDKKIDESERWDGLHGLITNMQDISPESAYKYYNDLWQIEDAFRINKSDLKIRPIFHWTEQRVEAHILISYVAYACYKTVEYKVNSINNTTYSHREIKKIVKQAKVNIHKDKHSENYYAIPDPITSDLGLIYQTFNQPMEQEPYCCTLDMAS